MRSINSKDKKYEITKEVKKVFGRTLHRIIALKDFADVKKGQLGGYVEIENNLSHFDNCWVYDNAIVMDWAVIQDNVQIRDNAIVSGVAWVTENAIIKDNAVVSMFSRVGGNAIIKNKAVILHYARVEGNAIVKDKAVIQLDSRIDGSVE